MTNWGLWLEKHETRIIIVAVIAAALIVLSLQAHAAETFTDTVAKAYDDLDPGQAILCGPYWAPNPAPPSVDLWRMECEPYTDNEQSTHRLMIRFDKL